MWLEGKCLRTCGFKLEATEDQSVSADKLKELYFLQKYRVRSWTTAKCDEQAEAKFKLIKAKH